MARTSAVGTSRRTAVVVTSYAGQTSQPEAQRLAVEGVLPRSAAVEVPRALGADVIDVHYMTERATRLARLVSNRFGLPAGQVLEVLLRRRRYASVLAWADRIGLPLSLANKLSRSRQDVVMVSVDLSGPKKSRFLQLTRSHSHLRAIVVSSSVQRALAHGRLGVPRGKLAFLPPGVDTEFWQGPPPAGDRRYCSVGWESRDYGTFVRASAEVDAVVEVALGSVTLLTSPDQGSSADGDAGHRPATARLTLDAFAALKGTQGYRMLEESLQQMGSSELPANVVWHQQLNPVDLRAMYERSQFVVIPLHDVSFDAGYTATVEAMSMGRPVIISRTEGQVDLIEDGVQGLYVPVGDGAALRAAIERLLASPEEVQRMGAAGRKLVEERYGLDRYVTELVELVRTGGQDRTGSGH